MHKICHENELQQAMSCLANIFLNSDNITAKSILAAIFLVFFVSVGLMALRVQRDCFTSNWQKLAKSSPPPKQIAYQGRWKTIFVRDTPTSGLLLFRINFSKEGIVTREFNPLTLLRLKRPRALFVPWDALSNFRKADFPWYHKLFTQETAIEFELNNLTVSMIVPWNLCVSWPVSGINENEIS